MENGKLNIFLSKKGKLITEIIFDTGKKITAPPEIDIKDDSLNGKAVQVRRFEGQISEITCGEQVLFKKQKTAAKQNDQTTSLSLGSDEMNTKNLDAVTEPAKTPYNFIPFNEKVINIDQVPGIDFKLNTYHPDRFTGHIDLEIETITPLYIRDSLTEDELVAEEASNENPDFFSPAGIKRIPGSSLRGLTRSILEIVSFGKFGFFDDKRLNFRSFADRARTLRDEYVKNMIKKIRDAYTIKPEAGYLKKDRNEYKIVPAFSKDGTTFYRVEESLLIGKSFYPEPMSNTITKQGETRIRSNKRYKFFFKKISFKKKPPARHRHSEIWLYYGEITDIDLPENSKNEKGWENGTLICSGWIPSKRKGKHMHWVINEENPMVDSLIIDETLIKSYRDDVNRDEQFDLLKQLERNPEGVPCFYITNEKGEVLSFGHTGMFRLAYEKSISEHIPDYLKNNEIVDMAEAIFGNEQKFAGRVFFEDAFLVDGQSNILVGESTPKILSSPKPTTIQHYLTQTKDDVRELNHYNTKTASIRGNKLYWHKSGEFWKETNQDQIQEHRSQYTKINPVKPGVHFMGRIRFENLSKIELGAMLFSIDLPDGCYHKLGMGKPLGLGSIKISPKLYLSKRKKRYEEFFFEWNNKIEEPGKVHDFKSAFEKYILTKIGEANLENLWDTKRLHELKTMLDYQTGVNLESQGKIHYMEINEFKDRKILPKASKV